ncbi:family 20 glycosylhydrolase [Streptomyces sp. NPDC057694]|uniref:family 20 glycosylhydrolase n=1 Tax=Streptomyces sp. NPDC057694 TaxID=3346216 RepID=UPI0036CE8F72
MPALIPRPAVAHRGPGALRPPAGTPWRISASAPGFRTAAETVRDLLAPHLGGRLSVRGGADQAHGPVLLLTDEDAPDEPRRPVGVAPIGESAPPDESYALTVDDTGIVCRARTPAGALRAATAAAQLLITTPPGEPLPHQQLRDGPHFAWRGLMLDPARTFLPPADLRRLIDVAALYRLNVLHLHLTDNEGWRLQIPGLPGLTPQRSGRDRDYYTVDEYRDLQSYAAARHITLIPEIDLPGHCAALRRALPGLPPAPAPEGLRGRFPFTPPLDLADGATRAAVSTVLAEVCALTDGPFVHIGGDEALGITDTAFAHAVTELRSLVREFGKRPVAWQEASRAGIEPGDILQHWVDVAMMDLPDTPEELRASPHLAASGHGLEFFGALKRFFGPTDHDVRRILDGGGQVLLSPQSHLYLDRRYAPETLPDELRPTLGDLGFATYRPRSTAYTAQWDPAAHGIPADRVAGVEATLFAEEMTGFEDISTLLLPRLAGVAEVAWSGRAPLWSDHRDRLAAHARWWAERGLPYAPTTDVPWTGEHARR